MAKLTFCASMGARGSLYIGLQITTALSAANPVAKLQSHRFIIHETAVRLIVPYVYADVVAVLTGPKIQTM